MSLCNENESIQSDQNNEQETSIGLSPSSPIDKLHFISHEVWIDECLKNDPSLKTNSNEITIMYSNLRSRCLNRSDIEYVVSNAGLDIAICFVEHIIALSYVEDIGLSPSEVYFYAARSIEQRTSHMQAIELITDLGVFAIQSRG